MRTFAEAICSVMVRFSVLFLFVVFLCLLDFCLFLLKSCVIVIVVLGVCVDFCLRGRKGGMSSLCVNCVHQCGMVSVCCVCLMLCECKGGCE